MRSFEWNTKTSRSPGEKEAKMNFMDDVREWSEREAVRRLEPVSNYHRYRIASRRAHNRMMLAAIREFIDQAFRIARRNLPRLQFEPPDKLPPVLTPRMP
jgi:hypothetical protein